MKLTDLLDRLDQEATKGPWKSHFGGNPHDEWLSVEPEKGSRTICTVTDDHHPNAEFIALARTALPSLSKALRAVLDVHQRIDMTEGHEPRYICATCTAIGEYGNWDQVEYPCGTVQAITDALGADGD